MGQVQMEYLLTAPGALLHQGRGLSKKAQIAQETGFNYICTGIDYPNEGGILVYYQNAPFPDKGLPNPDVLAELNIVKAVTMMVLGSFSKEMIFVLGLFFLIPFSWKIKLLKNPFVQFSRISHRLLNPYFLQFSRYCPMAQETHKLVEKIFSNLGFGKELSNGLGRIAAMFMEYDRAYRWPLQDLFSETSKEVMLQNPRKEFKRLFGLLSERIYNGVDKENTIGNKFLKTGKLISFALLHPKIKRAFVNALKTTDFQKLQLDAGDRYWALNRGEYSAFGMSLVHRMKIYELIHKKTGFPPYLQYNI